MPAISGQGIAARDIYVLDMQFSAKFNLALSTGVVLDADIFLLGYWTSDLGAADLEIQVQVDGNWYVFETVAADPYQADSSVPRMHLPVFCDGVNVRIMNTDPANPINDIVYMFVPA